VPQVMRINFNNLITTKIVSKFYQSLRSLETAGFETEISARKDLLPLTEAKE